MRGSLLIGLLLADPESRAFTQVWLRRERSHDPLSTGWGRHTETMLKKPSTPERLQEMTGRETGGMPVEGSAS